MNFQQIYTHCLMRNLFRVKVNASRVSAIPLSKVKNYAKSSLFFKTIKKHPSLLSNIKAKNWPSYNYASPNFKKKIKLAHDADRYFVSPTTFKIQLKFFGEKFGLTRLCY